MKIEKARFFENTVLIQISEKFAEAEFTPFVTELLEINKKYAYILVQFLAEVEAKPLEGLKLLKKKFTAKSALILVSDIQPIDAKTLDDGLKLMKTPTAKRISEILKFESEIKEVDLSLKSTDAVITNAITDLLKIPMPDKPFNSKEIDINLYHLNKNVGRLTHTIQVFFKEIDRIKKSRSKESEAALKNVDVIAKLKVSKEAALKLLKEKNLV